MNYVDLFLLLVVALSIRNGWKKGFIISSIALAVWLGSLFLGFIFYKDFAVLLASVIPGTGIWNLPLAFIFIVFISRFLFGFLCTGIFSRTSDHLHNHRVNRLFGIIPGLVNGVIYTIIISAILISAPLSDKLSDKTRESILANKLAVNVGWLDEKFSPIFDEAVKKSLSQANDEPESEGTVDLNFTVDRAIAREDLEAKMLDLINMERFRRGLKALIADSNLVPVARAHSADMFRRGYFSHYTPEGKDPFERMKASGLSYQTAGEILR